jgi:hypothetical protein
MKTIKLICFVIALFGLTFNSSIWAHGRHHHGHHRNHIGGLVLGLALGSVLRYGLGYGGYSGYNGYGTRYYLRHNAYRPVVTVPVVPSVYFQR